MIQKKRRKLERKFIEFVEQSGSIGNGYNFYMQNYFCVN